MIYISLMNGRKHTSVCAFVEDMKTMACNRDECFYFTKGKCVSMCVLSEDKCGRFLNRRQARVRQVPNRASMAALRREIDTKAPRIEQRYLFAQA